MQAAQLKVEGVALKRLQLAHETTLAAAKLQRVEETIPSLERLVALEKRPSHPQYVPPETSRLLDLTRGPGRLAAALRIDRSLDGVDLCAPGPLWLGAIIVQRHPEPAAATRELILGKSPRIGITHAAHRLLRFYERGSPFVSGPSRLRP